MKNEKKNNISLSDEDLLRYNKHILLDEIGIDGIELLNTKHIAIIGLGGIGCPLAQYLSTSGIGTITLIDSDIIEETNLQRQVLYTGLDIGKYKVDIASTKIKKMNPKLNVFTSKLRFCKDTSKIIRNVDMVIDATDNFSTRTAINAATIKYKKPLIMGAAIEMQGQISVFRNDHKDMPCYNCLYSDIEDQATSCINQGVLSSLTGAVGSILATEAIKVLLSMSETLESKLLLIDFKNMIFRNIKIVKDKKCCVCNEL